MAIYKIRHKPVGILYRSIMIVRCYLPLLPRVRAPSARQLVLLDGDKEEVLFTSSKHWPKNEDEYFVCKYSGEAECLSWLRFHYPQVKTVRVVYGVEVIRFSDGQVVGQDVDMPVHLGI